MDWLIGCVIDAAAAAAADDDNDDDDTLRGEDRGREG